ncbi:MAG TPA: DUF3419 family protein [Candidatus Cryosericum sp.]|nr:DUF3419 family protein [Candidatus Cryosericum sp.]
MKPETVWQAGRLDGFGGPPRLLFGRMHEDAEIERAAFAGKRRVFCIASAGCTALALADRREVVACDINPVQLAYAERRAAGGPLETGDADRAMSLVRTFMPVVGWRKQRVRTFLALANTDQQVAFWRERLDTRRFRAGFDLLLSRFALRTVIAPRLVSDLPEEFGAVLRRRLMRGFGRHPNVTNPHARALLLGEGDCEPPPRAPTIRFVVGDAASCLEASPARFFDGFALSNILDGADPAYGARLSRAIRHAARDDAVVVWRSFLEPPPTGHEANHAQLDRSMLWGVVGVGPATSWSRMSGDQVCVPGASCPVRSTYST